jgi:hypothetical protein
MCNSRCKNQVSASPSTRTPAFARFECLLQGLSIAPSSHKEEFAMARTLIYLALEKGELTIEEADTLIGMSSRFLTAEEQKGRLS